MVTDKMYTDTEISQQLLIHKQICRGRAGRERIITISLISFPSNENKQFY